MARTRTSHKIYGGNSGYQGYSRSNRAAQAEAEGRFPKTTFKQVYKVTSKSFDALVTLGVIDGREWHHTSCRGNRTHFYSWVNDDVRATYFTNKKAIDRAACKGESLAAFYGDFCKKATSAAGFKVSADKPVGEKLTINVDGCELQVEALIASNNVAFNIDYRTLSALDERDYSSLRPLQYGVFDKYNDWATLYVADINYSANGLPKDEALQMWHDAVEELRAKFF